MGILSGNTGEGPTFESVGRPEPRGYFLAADAGDGLLPWSYVEGRLVPARNYWIGTSSADGWPHSMPVWGIWREHSLHFTTSPASRKARNLAGDPRASMHLDDGDAVVVVEGEVHLTTDEPTMQMFVDLYNPKYDWDFTVEQVKGGGGVYVLRPTKAFAWLGSEGDSFGGTATRWRFSPAAQSDDRT